MTTFKRCTEIAVFFALLLTWLPAGRGFAAPVETESTQVVFISVAGSEEPYWGQITAIAQAAADDLNIDLEVLYSERDHLVAIDLAQAVVNRTRKPDYLIVVGEKQIASHAIPLAEAAGVKVLVFGDLAEEEKARIGGPRERYPHWIGQRRVDDFGAGYYGAKAIIDAASARRDRLGEDRPIHLVALSGPYGTAFSEERLRGLDKALGEHPEVVLLQSVPAYWRRNEAMRITGRLLKRFQAERIDAIWSANTPMALGAITSVEESGLVPGQDVFINGIDFTAEGIEALSAGALTALAGGHVTEVAWLLVMIYDYHHGIDFWDDPVSAKVSILTTKNVEKFARKFLRDELHQADFSWFSKVKNPGRQTYQFGFDALFER